MGFAFGSYIDNVGRSAQSQSGNFGVSLVILASAVIKADGKVLQAELDYVRQFFQQQFGADQTEEPMHLLENFLKQDVPLAKVSLQIKEHMPHPVRLQLLHFLFGISKADGEVHPKEVEVIASIAGYLDISDDEFASLKAMFYKDTHQYYTILEIEKAATNDEVKKAYHKMAVKYHPDKLSHLGEEFQKAAKEKFQKVSEAYEAIKKERGFN